jgi:hypothetical protein
MTKPNLTQIKQSLSQISIPGTGAWKRNLSSQDREDLVMVSAFKDKIDEVIAFNVTRNLPKSNPASRRIIGDLRRASSFVNRALFAIIESLDSQQALTLAKTMERHAAYVTSRKHDPTVNEIPIAKDELVDCGLAMLTACDVCGVDNQQKHLKCSIYRFMSSYFDIDRGETVCPFAEKNGGTE